METNRRGKTFIWRSLSISYAPIGRSCSGTSHLARVLLSGPAAAACTFVDKFGDKKNDSFSVGIRTVLVASIGETGFFGANI